MRIYLAGPMQGYKEFNFPAFRIAAHQLRQAGHEVFSPHEADEERHGKGKVDASATGDLADIKDSGFDLREALGVDTAWICAHAEGIAMLPGWELSKGAQAEWALARALGLQFIYL